MSGFGDIRKKIQSKTSKEHGKEDGMAKKIRQVSLKETISYSIYFLGQNLSFSILQLYLIVYFTDIGIPAMVVGIITLIVKIWDAINDPIFGGIVDKVKFRGGKFMPWLRISLLLLPLSTILLFAIPSGLPLAVKMALGCVGYIFWDISYTICDLPIFGLVTTLTNNQEERTQIMSFARIMALAAFIAAALLIPAVRGAFGGWLASVVVLNILVAAFMAPICVIGKERFAPKPTDDNFGLKDMATYLVKNKYLLLFTLAIIAGNILNTGSALGVLVARHLLGDEKYLSLLSIASIIPSLAFGACLPMLAKRIGKFIIFFSMALLSSAFGIIIYFIGYGNPNLYLVCFFIRSIPSGATLFMLFMFTPDCVEYGLYRTGINASGIAFSIQTFMAKFTNALGTAVGAFALAAIGCIESDGAIQSAGYEDKLWFVATMISALGSLLAVPFLMKYKLKDKYVQIMAKANSGEITRQEADALLGGRFS
jgi:sugar (glycoside-pentoside-hexuronide) transporter